MMSPLILFFLFFIARKFNYLIYNYKKSETLKPRGEDTGRSHTEFFLALFSSTKQYNEMYYVFIFIYDKKILLFYAISFIYTFSPFRNKCIPFLFWTLFIN